jgi:hypothetical protein
MLPVGSRLPLPSGFALCLRSPATGPSGLARSKARNRRAPRPSPLARAEQLPLGSRSILSTHPAPAAWLALSPAGGHAGLASPSVKRLAAPSSLLASSHEMASCGLRPSGLLPPSVSHEQLPLGSAGTLWPHHAPPQWHAHVSVALTASPSTNSSPSCRTAP